MRTLTLLAVCLTFGGHAVGADCYEQSQVAQFRPPPARELVVAVDETTLIPGPLAAELRRTINATLQPGDRVTLLAFSAISRERYVREVWHADIDQNPPPDRLRKLPAHRAQSVIRCTELQMGGSRKRVRTETEKLLAQGSASIQRSEIVFSLREIGTRLQASPVKDKVLVIVSDMIEHSAFGTFYAQRALALIDPVQEMDKVRAKGLLAPLVGVRVYVFGGGLASLTENYRDHPGVLALERFWSEYVKASGGQLVAFGKPALLVPIH